MKISCSQKNIQKASMLIEKITGKNPALPILNATLLLAQDKSLYLISTNLEMALEVVIPSKIEKEGKIAIPAKIFSNLLSSLLDNNLNFENKNDNLIVTTDTSSTTIKGYPVDDFPIIPKTKEKKSFTVSVFDFINGLKSVYYSSSLSDIKPELNSVFVYSFKSTPMSFVATDSFRLAEKNIPYSFSDNPNFLIPYRSVVEILRIFEEQEGDLKISLDDNNIVLVCNNIKFTSRLTGGVFPDYKQIIPTKFVSTATIHKKQFIESLRTAGMFCGKLNEVKVRIYGGENFIEIQTNNSDLGEHSVTIPAKTEGEDLIMMFNYRYLMDCLGFINSDQILFKFNGEGRPLLITGLTDSSFVYLIMPMKDM